MTRHEDWRARLASLVAARRAQAFVWGEADCCLWASDAVAAMTGRDIAAPLRGYSTRFGALRALRRAGFERVFDVPDAAGLAVCARARAGDLVGVPAWPLDALMIADGALAAWGQDERGLVRAPIPDGAIIWSV
ncbi:MAG: DUF6950 family protein [Beijerinckiaceae bacterium]